MITRRKIIQSSALMSLGGVAAGCATAQTELPISTDASEIDLGLTTAADDPVFGNAETAMVGTENSRHDEVRTAFRLLWDAPKTNDHMEIARYFETLEVENPNAVNRSGAVATYNEEWVGRANPLITSFFGMTSVQPTRGDQTFWCAAFVSFVLYAAGKANMLSALSGAYRRYSTPTNTPQPGDVVVFRKNGPDGDRGFGHVGFFVSQDEDSVEVLGGNQSGDTGSTGAVVTSTYAKFGRTLSLHSYRTVA